MKKRACIISYTDLARDPRPRNQIEWLKDQFEVTSIGTGCSDHNVEFIELRKMGFLINLVRTLVLIKLRLYNFYYWDKHKKSLIETLRGRQFDLIVVHEIRLLPLALKFAGDAKIVLDAHEYSPENFNDSLVWRFLIRSYYKHLCENYIRRAHMITTVSEGIAALYRQNFMVAVTVITSAAKYVDLVPKPVDKDRIRIIHHGICSSSRKLDLMIRAAEELDNRFEFNLMLVVSKSDQVYFNKLKRMVNKKTNVHFLPPVKSSELVAFCNDFDISISFFPPSNRNLQYALPNKFFEAIQSRLMVVTGPSTEMVRISSQYGFGISSKNFEPRALTDLINGLDANQVLGYKKMAHCAAEEVCARVEGEKFLDLINWLLLPEAEQNNIEK